MKLLQPQLVWRWNSAAEFPVPHFSIHTEKGPLWTMDITKAPFYQAGHKEKQQLDQTQVKFCTDSLGYESKPNYLSQSQVQSPS